MMLNAEFLGFRPSQIGAASLLLAVKLNHSVCDREKNLKDRKILTSELDLHARPLKMWDPAVEKLTGLSVIRDVKPLYITLFNRIFKPKVLI